MTGVIICYSRCWRCMLGDHHDPREAHTWMDDEDIEHAKLPMPSSPEDWERLGREKPCGCWCADPSADPQEDGAGEAGPPDGPRGEGE